MKKKDSYYILTSAMGLGTYVPALHLRDYLEEQGYGVRIGLYESCFSKETMMEYLKSKDAYHRDMRVAIVGHKLAARRLKDALDPETVFHIHKKWNENGITKFIILSGNWLDIVRSYQDKQGREMEVYIVHMDIGVAPSFQRFDNSDHFFTEIRPFDENGIHALIENHFDGMHHARQSDRIRIYIHGGGWGMGNYGSIAEELIGEEKLDILSAVYHSNEIQQGRKYSLLDSDWDPCRLDSQGRHQYPKMQTNLHSEHMVSIDNRYSNGLYSLYSHCDAIISKPGGSTLMDSLIVGVPVIFIDPIAEHEKVNASVWKQLGLGISFTDWKDRNFDSQILLQLQENIKKAKAFKPGVGQWILEHQAEDRVGGKSNE